MSDFVHLHVHTEYSLLDGLSKIPKLVTQAKIFGMNHLAITDHGSLYGALKFYKECKAEGINPLIGCEMYIAKRTLSDKETGEDRDYHHLTVLANSNEGYKNLMKLVTIAHIEGFYYRPRIDKDTLAKYSKGLMALSGCNSSEVAKAIVQDDIKKAKELVSTYRQIFGAENFYLEVQRHNFAEFAKANENSDIVNDLDRMAQEEKKIIEGSKKIAEEQNLKIVATNDIHYVSAQDAQAQDAIVCIQTGKTIQETKRLRMIDSPTYYLKSTDEMEKLFSDIPNALKNTIEIGLKTNIEIEIGKVAFPHFEVVEMSAQDYLKKLCFERITLRVEKVTKEIEDRLNYELDIISQKGYSTYFLVVADFVNWSRDNGIISTTRGSASGSLVSYALGITTVNPLYFKLPFERFLNPFRPTLPDIDVDFADNQRDEVIQYVRNKYGHNKVAQIGTFGTMMARGAVRDVARVLNWPYAKADKIAKMIPIGAQGFPMTIDLAKKQNRELGMIVQQDSEVKELLDLAEKVEGNARHVSVHAAGVVIAPKDLTNYTPLQKEATGEKIITQYDMHDIEEVGLVKMDFLGIRNLSILGHAVKIVPQTKKISVDLSKIPLNDKKSFQMLEKGETMGLFQLSGSGMTRYLKELKPTTIFDIMAMISLFRPGPMNSIPEFIERKNNPKKIKYFDKRMESYLDQSYGVIVYQDDVLLTAINIAGYTWEEADKFRKAMGKKIPAEMSKQKEKFIDGAVKNGLSPARAEELFKLIEPFAAYGFNKAHAASYAVIAYQTAYMKANFPVEFMTAVMTAEADDPDKISAAVSECAKMNIPVFPPDANFSQTGFTIEKQKGKEGIRFGLSAIKNVGKAAIEAIISERDKNSAFRSLDDFVRRVNMRVVNKKTMESLIKAGAMDLFGKRNAMLKVLDDLKSQGSSISKAISEGQGSLFDEADLSQDLKTASVSAEHILNNTEEAPKEEILSWERELLGFYLTEHPLNKVADKMAKLTSGNIGELDYFSQANQVIRLGGIISSVRRTFTKVRKEEMCFLKLQDTTGTIEVIVFPKTYAASKHLIQPDQIVIITGKTEAGEETPVLIADSISSLDQEITKPKIEQVALEIKIPKDADRIALSKIYQVLKNSPGPQETYLILPSDDGRTRKFPVPFGVERTLELEDELLTIGCFILD